MTGKVNGINTGRPSRNGQFVARIQF